MGAEPWTCFTPYRSDIELALREAQEREFKAGNYDPYGILEEEGIQPESIEQLRELMEESGTGTIHDVQRISDSIEWFASCPLAPQQLQDLYGTDQPTRAMVETNFEVFNVISVHKLEL